jgi:hypothetical protein
MPRTPVMTGRRWAYAGALLGGGVSIAANVAHSYVPPVGAPADWAPHAGAVVGAVFWPVALFVAIEILARVAWPDGRRWVLLRFGGLLPVAAVAAFVSYRHLSGLLTFYGDETAVAVLGPLAVDGLMVMATGALIATSRARAATPPATVDAAAKQLKAELDEATQREQELHAKLAEALAELAAVGTQDEAQPKLTAAAKKIARARQRQPSLTQQEAAQRAGVHINTVKSWWAHTAPSAPDPEPVNGRVPDLEGVPS